MQRAWVLAGTSHDHMTSVVCASHTEENKELASLIFSSYIFTMLAFFQRILDWFKSLFWKEEMELTLVGLQYSGKTTFVNVIAVSWRQGLPSWSLGRLSSASSVMFIWLSCPQKHMTGFCWISTFASEFYLHWIRIWNHCFPIRSLIKLCCLHCLSKAWLGSAILRMALVCLVLSVNTPTNTWMRQGLIKAKCVNTQVVLIR